MLASCFNLIISKVIFGILIVSFYTLKSAIRLLFFERYYDIHIKLLNMNECVNLSTKKIKGNKCYLKDWKFSHACTCKKEKISLHQSLAFIVLSFVKAKYNKIWCNEFIRTVSLHMYIPFSSIFPRWWKMTWNVWFVGFNLISIGVNLIYYTLKSSSDSL